MKIMGIRPWIFTGRTNAEAEAPVFWSSGVHRQLIEKVPDAGKDWGQKEKRASEDETVGWHELVLTPGDGEGQEGLVCCSPWSLKESDTNGWLKTKQQILSNPWLRKFDKRESEEAFIHPSIQWLFFECSNVPSGKMKVGYHWVQILLYHLLAVWPWTGFIFPYL